MLQYVLWFPSSQIIFNKLNQESIWLLLVSRDIVSPKYIFTYDFLLDWMPMVMHCMVLYYFIMLTVIKYFDDSIWKVSQSVEHFPSITRPEQKSESSSLGKMRRLKKKIQIENHVNKLINSEITLFTGHYFVTSAQLSIISWYHSYDSYHLLFWLELYMYMHPLLPQARLQV